MSENRSIKPPAGQPQEALKREISLWGLTANIINIIVGAGIFVLPATIAMNMGAESVIAYLFCGILLLLVMLCFAEIGSKVTISGGPYAYVHEAFGDGPGFVTAILYLMSALLADAAVINALYEIVSRISPALDHAVFRILFFGLVFGGLAYLNVRGVKEGIRMVQITAVTKLIPLIFLVTVGWFAVSGENLLWTDTPNIEELAGISLVLFFAFQGSESALPVSGEVKNPKKNIPRAILISLFFILTLYMLIQLVTQGILGSELASYQDSPLAEAAFRAAGPLGFTVLGLGATVSMFGMLTGSSLNSPRVLYSVARDKIIPSKPFSFIHPRFKTPYVAVLTYAFIGFTLASLGGFKSLAVASSVSVLLIYLGIAAAVIKYRRIHPEVQGFHIPGGNIVPVLTIGVILWFINGLSNQELVTGGIVLATVILLYFILKFLRSKTKSQN